MSVYVFTGLYLAYVVCSMAFSIVEYKINYSARKFVVLAGIVLLSILMGLRPFTVPDTIAYYRIFNQEINLSSILKNGFIIGGRYLGIEYMYYVLVKVAHIIGMSFQVFMGMISFVCNCLVMNGFSNIEMYLNQPNHNIFGAQQAPLCSEIRAKTPLISIWTAYLCLFGFMYSGVVVRAFICVALGMTSVTILLKNNSIIGYFSSALLVFIGTSFHTSGLIYFVILLVMLFAPKIDKKKFAIIWIILVFLLMIKFGETIATLLNEAMNYIRNMLNITSFSSYISKLEFKIGKWDWYYVIVIGIISILTFTTYSSSLNVHMLIIIGLAVIAIMYPFSAISRVSDFFMMFLIPVVVSKSRKYTQISKKRIIYILILLLLLPIQIMTIIRA